MTKKRRRWGLLGLLGLGGLALFAWPGSANASESDDDKKPGGGGDDDDPTPATPGSKDDDDNGGTNDDGYDDDGPEDDGYDDDGDDDDPPPVSEDDPKDDPAGGDDPPGPTNKPKPPRAPQKPKPKPTTDDPSDDDTDDDDPDKPKRQPTYDPPWSELIDPYPRGERFYQVVRDDRFGGMSTKHSIAYRFLLSEAYLAALEVGGLSHEESLTWAAAVGKQDKVRLKVIDLYQCSGWNDAVYGADPVSVSRASAHGRSILLRPVHAPNVDRIAQGEAPARNVTMGGNPADKDWRHYELLWSPGIDRVKLWDSGGQVVSTTGIHWPDGSSKENPPPWVMDLAIEDATDLLDGVYGCPDADGEVTV